MEPILIIFIALNVAVPSWLYFSSKDAGDTPRIKWAPFEENLTRVVKASGGFDGCPDSDVVQYIRNLCERSQDKFKGNDSVIIERASSDTVFSCEARADATFVQWRVEPSQEADLPCTSRPQKDSLSHEPTFVFDRVGELMAIEFDAQNGERQAVKSVNCAKKLELVSKKTLSGKGRLAAELPRLKSDPPDYLMANKICIDYHVAEGWEKLRGLYKQ